MVHKCNQCGLIFHNWQAEFRVIRGLRTDLGMQIEPDETIALCPECLSDDLSDGDTCEVCGKFMLEDDLSLGMCEDCLEEERKQEQIGEKL